MVSSCGDSGDGNEGSKSSSTGAESSKIDSSKNDGSADNNSQGDGNSTAEDDSGNGNPSEDDNSSSGDDNGNNGNNGDNGDNGDNENNGDGGNNGNSGSNSDDTTQPTMVKYIVRVIDAFGNIPEQSVIVEMFKDGQSFGETSVKRGSAVFQLAAGEYTFEVKPMEGEFYYDKTKCILTEEENEITVTIYNCADENNKEDLYIPDETGLDHVLYRAVQVDEGATYVNIDRAAGSYFLFTPTRGGIYRISYEASRAVTIGYYGSPHNVLSSCPVDVVDGAFELEIKNEGVNIGNVGGTTQVVIGIRSYTVKGCVLKIERIGNATVDLPWTNVQVDKNATKADNYINSEFVDFDVTDESLSVVYNETDGFYHLNTIDGPIIYIRITNALVESSTGEETIYKYLPALTVMCETDRLCKVFYDSEGKVIHKESYNDLLKQYGELCGAQGLYPLNAQLAEVIKNIGEHKGWFDLSSELHIFRDEATEVFQENAWLFACVYENQMAKGTQEKPATVTPSAQASVTTNAALIENGMAVALRTISKGLLTINNAQGLKVVANDGVEYVPDAETGTVSVVIKANQTFTIEYEGEEETTVVQFTFVEHFE